MVKLVRAWVLLALLWPLGVARADALDQCGDPLPEGAIARLGSTRLRPAGPHIAFTPDSKFVATSYEGQLSIFNAHDGKLVRSWRSNHASTASVAFTPDGKRLLAGAGSTAFPYQDHAPGLWDWQAGKLLRRIQVPPRDTGRELGAMILSPDGKQVALRHIEWANPNAAWIEPQNKITASTITLRKLKNDRIVYTWPGSAFAFSPDGKHAALGSKQTIQIIDLKTGKPLRALAKVYGEASKLAFTPDGKTLAALIPGLEFWDVASGERHEDFLPGKRYYTHIEFCMARKLPWIATRDPGGTAHVWDMLQRKRLVQFESPGQLAAFAPDDQTLAMRQELLLRLWDTKTWRERCRHDGHETWVSQAVYSPDSRRVATCAGPRIMLWETATGKLLLTKDCSAVAPRSVTDIKWSPDGRTIVSLDQQLRFWDTATGKDVATLSFQLTHRGYLFHPRENHVVTFFPSRTERFSDDFVHWDPRSSKELSRRYLGNLKLIAQSPSGQWSLLADGAGRYRVWDGDKLRDIKLPDRWGTFIGLNDRHIAFTDGFQVSLWDCSTLKEVWKTAPFPGKFGSYGQFSPEGNYLYLEMSALRIRDGRLVRSYDRLGSEWSYDCRLSPDGRVLVSVVAEGRDMKSMQFVSTETATGKVRRHFAVPSTAAGWTIRLEQIAPDSKTFLSRGPGLSALVWDLVGLDEARRQGPPGPDDLETLWQELAGADAAKAYRAAARLAQGKQAARDFLAKKLTPVRPVDAKHIARLIEQLVDDDETFRKKAFAALCVLDRQAEPALRQALKAGLPMELRATLERLLDELDGLLSPGPLLQQVRAVEALEHLGATKVLADLARGDRAARLTQECKGALKRLE
jgi:WD40 repeat protein